jgi:hypothetical protein
MVKIYEAAILATVLQAVKLLKNIVQECMERRR